MDALAILVMLIVIAAWFWRPRRCSQPNETATPEPLEYSKTRKRRAPRQKVRSLPKRFIVADIETTGLNPNSHQIIEIGAIAVDSKTGITTSFSTLVRNERGRPLDRKIVRLTGITDEMLEKDGQPLSIAMAEFLEFIADDVLVFYNPAFDRSFLCRAAEQMGRSLPNEVQCALQLARKTWPELPRHRLSDVVSAQGLQPTGAHRVLEDCQMTLSIYLAAVAAPRSMLR